MLLLVRLERCAFHTQMRQLVTLRMCSRALVKTDAAFRDRVECNNINLSNLGAYRSINTNPQRRSEDFHLPPLMWQKTPMSLFPLFNICMSYLIIRTTIDREFRLKDFVNGARQAISVISNALATQNYDMLDGIVKERSIKILRHRVDRLTQTQRELISVDLNRLLSIPGFMTIRKTKGDETIVEIDLLGVNVRDVNENTLNASPIRFIFCYYTFQRKYADGVGGAWTAKVVNHVAK
ncbi:m-AAA protease-interacting protein 1, mitochondrial [Ceratina calcarata]|uniref:M-AAA protease-interacting protein 1, mitochondrial n=1 Tax=Ceratina calcarata TaxID=156304 RepID=A0AAJ7N6H7_9HYME|nr:m-AAA protease-interacting protein 1, mitochondrial [Ceratina calcarata]